MHRMHRLAAVIGMTFTLTLGAGAGDLRAELARPDASLTFPGIYSGVHGHVDYEAATGQLTMTNTPYVFDLGVAQDWKIGIGAGDTGLSQSLSVLLDSSGNLIHDASNRYEVHGKVTLGDSVFEGLLLAGTPSTFGFQDLGHLGISADFFDADIVITGGALASLFNTGTKGAYLRFKTDLAWSGDPAFTGDFTTDFQSFTPTSFLVRLNEVTPLPAEINPPAVPEPGSLLLVVAGGLGIALRRRMRRATP